MKLMGALESVKEEETSALTHSRWGWNREAELGVLAQERRMAVLIHGRAMGSGQVGTEGKGN